MRKSPQTGTQGPAFSALADGGEYTTATQIHLSDFVGEIVLLYFYPKDDPPGCTKQACALRDGWSEISAKAKIFGVSTDPIKSHENFIKKRSLPFAMISDGEP